MTAPKLLEEESSKQRDISAKVLRKKMPGLADGQQGHVARAQGAQREVIRRHQKEQSVPEPNLHPK